MADTLLGAEGTGDAEGAGEAGISDTNDDPNAQAAVDAAATAQAAADAAAAAKGADGKSADATGDDDKGDGAPDTYETFALPEGIVLNEELVTAFSDVAREANLTQDMAQRLVDLQTAEATRAATEQQEVWDATVEQWRADAQADKDIGGADFEANVGLAKAGLDAVGTPALVELLNSTGTGNHVEIIRAFQKIGKMVSEDSMQSGGQNTNTPRSAAQRLYPNQGKQ